MKYLSLIITILIVGGWISSSQAQIPGPGLIAPADGTIDLEFPSDFFWSSISDIFNYQLQIDSTPDFSSGPLIFENYIYDSTVTLYLTYLDGLTMYWRVRAWLYSGDSTLWSETWSFTIYDRRPVPQIPAEGQSDVNVPVMFQWTSPLEVEYYFISVDDEPTFTYPYYFNEWATSDTFLLWNNMYEQEIWPSYNKTYYYKLQSQIDLQRTLWTDTWSFTTVDATPDPTAPLDNALDESIPVYFEWDCAVDADHFAISIDDEPGFSPPLAIDNYVLYSPSYSWPDAELGTTYYWKVQTYATYGVSDWSETRSFTTHCPVAGVPTPVAPGDGASLLNQPILLDWESVGGAYSYWLQVSETSDFATPVVDGQLSWDDRTVHGLTAGNTYYWRICAMSNVCGWSDWSPVWSFTPDVDYVCGDVNDDNGLNILDVTYIIYYLYKSGPPPICW